MEESPKNKLQAHMSSETGELRPIAISLNGDNSWLFWQGLYHIVYEPWLNDSANDMGKWLTEILQPVHAAIDSPVAVGDAITEIKNSAVARLAGADKISTPNTLSEDALKVDAILLMFYLPDHVHQSTLYQFDKRIPVFATPDAMATPSWLMPWFLPGHRAVNPARALVWTHTDNDGKEVNKSILTSIHGSQPKYWLANHDSLFTYDGLLHKSVQLNDVGRTVDWALEQEEKVDGISYGVQPSSEVVNSMLN
ncbi:hypothetical protein J3F84DRAFT_398927 [Trichoderma pleuroticola]